MRDMKFFLSKCKLLMRGKVGLAGVGLGGEWRMEVLGQT